MELELIVKPAILSTLLVPLKMGGAVMGLLVIGDIRPGALNTLEEKGDIASLLALAMEKTRLSYSVTKRDQEMESIKQIGSILAASTFDRQEVLKHTMDMIRTIMNVEAGSLLLIEDDELAFKVAFNSNPRSISAFSRPSASNSDKGSPAIPPLAANLSSSPIPVNPGNLHPISTGRPVFTPARSSACRSSPGDGSWELSK